MTSDAFWGMTDTELDEFHIQKPVDAHPDVTPRTITVNRWRKLPTLAFRPNAEPVSGSYETLVHECFVHPADRDCEHEPGRAYVVDPDAPDRVAQFKRLWTHPDDVPRETSA